MSTPADDVQKALAQALGRIPSGLFVITLSGRGGDTCFLASWVQQCSFDPPQVSVAARSDRGLTDLMTPGTSFTINILGEGQNSLVGQFARGGQAALEGQPVERPAEGGIILRDALGWLHCQVAGRCSGGDHDLVIGRVLAGKLHREGKPMVHIRKNGLTY